MPRPLSRLPLLPIALALAGGIAIGKESPPIFIAIPIIIAVICLCAGRRLWTITALAISLGMSLIVLHAPYRPPLPTGPVTLTAVVREVNEGETTRRITVEVNDHGSRPYLCLITTPSTLPPVSAGDKVTFCGELKPTTSSTDLPDEFDPADNYHSKGIITTIFVKPGDLEVTGRAQGIVYALRDWKESVSDIIMTSRLNDDCARFLCATLLGERQLLDNEIQSTFTTAGIAHILAISGMHVGIIAMILSIALFPFTLMGAKRTVTGLITIAALWIYAIMTGLTPSIVRAVVMATLVWGSYILQRSHSSGNALCCAAIIILIFQPGAIFSISFQLSFAAVAAILAYTSLINQSGIVKNRWERWIANAIGIPLSATIGTSVIVMFHFHEFPVYFLVTNIPVALLLPFFTSGGILLLALHYTTGIEPQWLITSINCVYDIINSIAAFAAEAPCASISGIYFSCWAAIPALSAIASLYCWAALKRRFWGYISLVSIIAATTAMLLTNPYYPENEYYITRNSSRTDIIIKRGRQLQLVTTAHPHDINDVLAQCRFKYRDYMGKRHIDSLELLESCPIISIGADRWAIISDSKRRDYKLKTDYILVCRGFNGDVIMEAKRSRCDTVVLSRDLHRRRHDRYMRELIGNRVPVISLYDHPYHKRF